MGFGTKSRRIYVVKTAGKIPSLVLALPKHLLLDWYDLYENFCFSIFKKKRKSESYKCVFSFVSFYLCSRYVPTPVRSLSWEGEGDGPQQSFRLWWSSWQQAVLFFRALPSVVVVVFGLSWHLSLKGDACSKNAALLLPSVFKNCLLWGGVGGPGELYLGLSYRGLWPYEKRLQKEPRWMALWLWERFLSELKHDPKVCFETCLQ